MSNKSGRTNQSGQLRALKDRLTPAELERRETKREYRQQVSVEHAKTRGALTMLAQQTRNFYLQQRRLNYAAGLVGLGLILHALAQAGVFAGLKLW